MSEVRNEDCFVAFLDILGFSDAVLSKSPYDIENIFNTIKMCKNKIEQDKCAWPSEYDDLSNNTSVYIMSDSIVLAIKSNISGALEFLIKWCREIQLLLLTKHRLLVRGGISQGMHYQDKEVAFGVGFVKAHILESTAKTPRILIDEALCEQCGADVLEDEDNKKYINFLGECYWDDKETDNWLSFADENIQKAESLVEKYQWMAKRFEECRERYLIRQYQEDDRNL